MLSERSQTGCLDAGSVAKNVRKIQALLAAQEREPILISCNLTLVQIEAILGKVEVSKSCLRFHLSASGSWDCYFYQDPSIEHESALGGLNTAMVMGIMQIRETLAFESSLLQFNQLLLHSNLPDADSLFHFHQL